MTDAAHPLAAAARPALPRTGRGAPHPAIAADPAVRMRDVALRVGVTERAVQAIVADLVEAGYLTRERVGRRNHYTVDPAGPFRHPAEAAHRIGELLALFDDH